MKTFMLRFRPFPCLPSLCTNEGYSVLGYFPHQRRCGQSRKCIRGLQKGDQQCWMQMCTRWALHASPPNPGILQNAIFRVEMRPVCHQPLVVTPLR